MRKKFIVHFWLIAALAVVITCVPQILTAFNNTKSLVDSAAASGNIDVWWPTNSAVINGVQPFKALDNQLDVSQYNMFWQVDNGQWNYMAANYTDWPHKEAVVDLTGWNWRGSGPYNINFIVQNFSGQIVDQRSVNIYTQAPTLINAPIIPAPTPSPTPTPTPTTTTPIVALPTTPTQTNTTGFYVDPNSPAIATVNSWASSRPADAAQIQKIATQPQAFWFGEWSGDIYSAVNSTASAAAKIGKTPILVAYNIPQRDCGGYSAGGVGSPSSYKQWISDFAKGIGNRKAWVILEPDALASENCLSGTDQNTRESLLRYAVQTLGNLSQTKVYLDAGNPHWIDANTMAARLKNAGIASADGFSLNVSNFFTTEDNISFGQTLSSLLGNKHFVIDTSRNGLGPTPDYQWCNPSGRALGYQPTTNTNNSLVDAFLWIKRPGESDGYGNGGPSAGTWWPDYALGLAQRASF